MNFPSIARLLLHPLCLALSGSALVHAAAVGLAIYFLLAFPQIWIIHVQQGEAVVIQAQMAAVAATTPEVVNEIDVSIEPVPVEPPPPVAVEHAPLQDTLTVVPNAMPVARSGEYEPTDLLIQQQPPESPANVVTKTKVPPRELAKAETKPVELATKSPKRQVADVLRDSPSKVNLAAAAPTIAGVVDEMPRKLSNNRIPYYPREALRAGIEGRVVLRVRINAAGRAEKIAVENSSGFTGFDSSAIDAVRDWRFAPAKRGGIAVAHEVLVPVRFRINRG